MGVKRGQGQRTYRGHRYIERERNRISTGDIVAIEGKWRTVVAVRAGFIKGETKISYELEDGGVGYTTGRSHNPIKKSVEVVDGN